MERHFCAPVFQEADDDLLIRVDSTPGEAWNSDPLSVRLDIESFARQLRDALAASH